MRCAPRSMARRATRSRSRTATFDVEANAATDNPMVFADTREIVSGGNFHGAPVASPPTCSVSGSRSSPRSASGDRIGSSTRRRSGLPAFLTRHGGLQSGLMMAQVTAAALTSELKTLAHPASVDTIPTSGNKRGSRQHEHGRRAEGGARASSSRDTSSPSNCCARARRSICCSRSSRRRR